MEEAAPVEEARLEVWVPMVKEPLMEPVMLLPDAEAPVELAAAADEEPVILKSELSKRTLWHQCLPVMVAEPEALVALEPPVVEIADAVKTPIETSPVLVAMVLELSMTKGPV